MTAPARAGPSGIRSSPSSDTPSSVSNRTCSTPEPLSSTPERLWHDGAMTVPESPETGAPVGRTGVVLRDPLAWSDAMLVVETAEDTGYEAVFVPGEVEFNEEKKRRREGIVVHERTWNEIKEAAVSVGVTTSPAEKTSDLSIPRKR